MVDPLLMTKLYRPPPRAGLITRPRVTEKLTRGLDEGRRLTLISAPAGYGKTTAAVQWLASVEKVDGGADQSGQLPVRKWAVSWLALDEGDNDPARFFAYLVAALRQADPAMGQTALDLMAAPRFPSVPSLMTGLINDIALSGTPILLVLDDYHAIHAAGIHRALDFLCQHAPPLLLHLALLTRADPPLALSGLRAGGQLTEVRGGDLAFTEIEAAAFFAQTMGLALTRAAAGLLAARTEGWIAGLQLAALSLQGCDAAEVDEFVTAFSGSDRFIMDYLVEEVLQRLPADLRVFLYQTAILERFCAPLCDAVCDPRSGGTLSDPRPSRSEAERRDSRDMLARLDQANLLLVRLDTQGRWYRYHQLFAEFLKLELDAERQTVLHGRAAAWFEANGYLPEAIDHALSAGNHEDAARLIKAAAEDLLARSEFQTLLRWIERLPSALVAVDGELAAQRALARFFTGETEQAVRDMEELRNSPTGSVPTPALGRLLALRAFLASLRSDPATRVLAEEALRLVGADEALYQMAARLSLGFAQNACGHMPAATQTFRDTYTLGRRTGHALAALGGLFMLAKNLLEEGRRREALAVCEEALPRYLDRQGRPLPLSGLIYHPLSMIHYQGNDLDMAWECAVTGLRLARQLISEDVLGWEEEKVIACVQYARGDIETALATARRMRQAAERSGHARGIVGLRSLEAEFYLRRGDLAAARRWAESEGYRPYDTPAVECEMAYRVFARFLLVDGRVREARELLATIERGVRSGHRYGRLIALRVLQAVVEETLGNHRLGLEYLAEAVCLAAPEGYRRLFLDAGETAWQLLPEVRPTAAEFVDSLAASDGRDTARPDRQAKASARIAAFRPGSSQGLVEPLTARELEVLNLLAQGRSYREIAESLIVATGTVQAHCGNIYGKLGVNNRTQALARARDLGLL